MAEVVYGGLEAVSSRQRSCVLNIAPTEICINTKKNISYVM